VPGLLEVINQLVILDMMVEMCDNDTISVRFLEGKEFGVKINDLIFSRIAVSKADIFCIKNEQIRIHNTTIAL
jgi:hypothetical protein